MKQYKTVKSQLTANQNDVTNTKMVVPAPNKKVTTKMARKSLNPRGNLVDLPLTPVLYR